MSEMLSVAKDVAVRAGDMVMKYYNSNNYSVIDKGKYEDNFATEADREAETFIISELKKHFPSHGFRGEEINSELPKNEFIWLIDPIDGTRNFVLRNGQFSVMIGLLRNNDPILGVVYAPVDKKLYYAEKGKGAFLNGRRIKVSHNTITNLRSVSNRSIKSDKELQKINNKIPHISNTRFGSSGYKHCLLAEGLYDVYVTRKNFLNEWDLCASMVVLEEAGGKVSKLDGNRPRFNKENPVIKDEILSSNGVNHKEIIKIISST